MRRHIIAANWKMNKTLANVREFLIKFVKWKNNTEMQVDIIICPPSIYLMEASTLLYNTDVKLSAQNIYFENAGAFTGEISAPMLKSIGCYYSIIGHSERRAYFHETDADVNKKLKALLENGMNAILCLGETLHQRENGETKNVVQAQLSADLYGIESRFFDNIIIAYEPIWAIGTGKTATPEDAEDVQKFIRQWIANKYNQTVANNLRILYGGSINHNNIADLISQPDIDGGLIGGASLDKNSFIKIVEIANRIIGGK